MSGAAAMRIALIDITDLTRLRETFAPGWRAFIAVTYLLSVVFWWGGLTHPRGWDDLAAEALKVRTPVIAALALVPLAVALFSKGDFARTFFVLAIALVLLTLTLILLVVIAGAGPATFQDDMSVFLALLGVLSVFAVYAKQLFRPFRLLLASLTPFGRRKAFRRQVLNCLRLWSGEWKSAGEPRGLGEGERPYLNAGTPYRLALGWLWFALGVLIVGLALYGVVNDEFLPALARLELFEAWRMLSHFEYMTPEEAPDTVAGAAFQVSCVMLVLLVALFCFFVFGFFLTQWRREHIPVHRVPLLEHLTSSDLLLLRSFDDDVKYVARDSISVWTLVFRAYGWSYTFEQLIVSRLKYLGRVLTLDFEHKREGLLSRWGVRHAARVVGADRLRGFLTSVLPAVWYRLPAQGGVRYYVDAGRTREQWQEEVGRAMLRARAIVLMIGETGGLAWEMEEVGRRGLSGKTLFVMPPLVWKKNYRARWRQFADAVCRPLGCDPRLLDEGVDPRRVLAVTVREGALVVMKGKGSSQAFYESALDLASLLAVADPAESGPMLRGHLN